MRSPDNTDAWQALNAYHQKNKAMQMRELFAADSHRGQRLSLSFNELYLDYSKNLIDDTGLNLLTSLAYECGVSDGIRRMFDGERINFTEDRAVLHTALRHQGNDPVLLDGEDVVPAVRSVLARLEVFSDSIRTGMWQGYTGKKIRNVVNIGIGGSHLGPQMVTEALKSYALPGLNSYFVSNIDGADIGDTLERVDPETTLFIIASKSFTTQETMKNADTARKWFLRQGGSGNDIARHFVAVSTNGKAVADFGINLENMFEFWDWVGGRYSLWSAIGLPIILSIGFKRFSELLAGAFEMDQHFRQSPFQENMPVILAMLGIWYINFYGTKTHAVLPYANDLGQLPDYLQQADMESNGKHIRRDGSPAPYQTAPIIWGSAGTNGQHAYFQLLHQGTQVVPADFIAVINASHNLEGHHELLLANCLAQSEALMLGRDLQQTLNELGDASAATAEVESAAMHRVFDGNRPSNTLVMTRLNPRNLGSLLALYEHKIFVQGLVWGINSYDQWGVELGKQLADAVLPELRNGAGNKRSSSTRQLINYCRDKTER